MDAEPTYQKVQQDGFEYGENEAERLVYQEYSNASPEVLREAYQRFQDGDDSFWEQVEESPLSGEWADGPNIREILEAYVDDPDGFYDNNGEILLEAVDEAAEVWRTGYDEEIRAGFEKAMAPLVGAMDEPGETYLPQGWTAGWTQVNEGFGPEHFYHMECPKCGSDYDYRQSALPGQYHCSVCGEYSSPDHTGETQMFVPEDWNRAAAVHKVQVKCPNCGTLSENEVCTKCGKGLEPEWNKIDQGKDVPWESLPQAGTPQNEFLSDPTDRVPKVNWDQQDNQFGTMISHVRTAVDDTENWQAPDAPPGYFKGHGDVVTLLEERATVDDNEFF